MIVEKDHILVREKTTPKYFYMITRGVGEEKLGSFSKMHQRGNIIALNSLVTNYNHTRKIYLYKISSLIV